MYKVILIGMSLKHHISYFYNFRYNNCWAS